MNLCVIGTSNCALADGFLNGVIESGMFTIGDKRCMGGCPSMLLSFELPHVTLSNHEYFLIDTCINDEIYISSRKFNILDVTLHLWSAVESIRSTGAGVIIVALPMLKRVGGNIVSYRVHKAIAERAGCLFFDGYAWLSSELRRTGLPLEAAFRDPNHLTPTFSLSIGRAIAKYISRHGRISKTGARRSDLPSCPVMYQTLPIDGRSGVTRRSSLRDESFIPLQLGETLSISLPTESRLCGFSFNSATSSGYLQFFSEDAKYTVLLSTDNLERARKRGKELFSQIVPISTFEVYGELRLALASDAEVYEKPINGIAGPTAGEECSAELGHLLVEIQKAM